MNILRVSSLTLLGAVLALGATNADAQHRRHGGGHGIIHGGGGHQGGRGIIHGGGVIRGGGHGVVRHGLGVVHGNVHGNSTFVVPHVDTHHNGSYYVRDGGYFYSPQTRSTGTTHTTAYRPQPVVFGSFSHVDDLASRFATLSNEFCLDLHYNYPNNPGFGETYREAYEILQTAQYIDDAEHRNDREAIRGRLEGLDQRFHHVQSDVRGWKRHHHRQVGRLGIQAKMDVIESTLHHLMNDVGVRPAALATGSPTPAPAGGSAPAPAPSLP